MADTAATDRTFDDALAAAKIEALKEFAYGAGHEINNPLANISARAQTLLRDETHPERRRMLAAIHRQAFRAHEMIADLMLFARPPQLERREVDAAAIVRQVVAECAADAQAQATRLSCELPEAALRVYADPVQLAVAVKAVVRNALEALAAGGNVTVVVGRIVVETSASEAAGFHRRLGRDLHRTGGAIEISVADDGPGFSPREQAHLFDPFFSGREAGRGLGFGLCKAWRIVTDHGGEIAVASQAGRGSTVSIVLPATA
jgi:signal transduction histidine kinase